MESIFYKSTEQLWEQRWHLHTLTSSWGNLKKLIKQSASHKPFTWFCFIYDVDMKWTKSEETLNRFFDHVNNVHPTIQFTHETSPFWIPVKMVLLVCQLTYTTNRQINTSTCPHRVVILSIAPNVFHTAKLSE